MKIILIAACTTEYVIGKNGKMPWHLPPDLKRFQELTMGHPIIMGRKTYESIGKPLKGRENIVVSRNSDLLIEGAYVAHSVDAAIAHAATLDETIFIIGGANVYQQALPNASVIYLTVIFQKHEGDTFFPKPDLKEWVLVTEDHRAENGKLPAFSFCKYERRQTHAAQ